MGQKFIVGADALWRIPQVLEVTGFRKSKWWELVREGIAPQGIKLGARITVWRASEVQAFIEKVATGGLSEKEACK